MEHFDLGILVMLISKIVEQYKNEVIICRMSQILFTNKIDNISNDKIHTFSKYLQQPNKSEPQTGGVSDDEKLLHSLFLNEIRLFKELVFFTAFQTYIMDFIIAVNTSSPNKVSKKSKSQHGGVGFKWLNALTALLANVSLLTLNDTSTMNNVTLNATQQATFEQANNTMLETIEKLEKQSPTSDREGEVAIVPYAKSPSPKAHSKLVTLKPTNAVALYFFQDKSENEIRTTIHKFNENMTDITAEVAKECATIVYDIMDMSRYDVIELAPEPEPMPEKSGSMTLSGATSYVTTFFAKKVANVAAYNKEKADALMKIKLDAANQKKEVSTYLNFMCHQAFISTIQYDGENITMSGGSLSFDNISHNQTMLYEHMKASNRENPGNDKLRSTLQRFKIIIDLTNIFDLEISTTFKTITDQITGTPDISAKFNKHLTAYVNSITRLLPYLSKMFPLDLMDSERGSKYKESAFESHKITVKDEIKYTKAESDLTHELSTEKKNAEVRILHDTATRVKELAAGYTSVPLGAVEGVFEGAINSTGNLAEIGTKGTERVLKNVMTTGYNLMYHAVGGPFGLMALIVLGFVTACLFGGTAIAMSPFVFIPKTAFRIVKFALGSVWYVFEKVKGRFIFRGTEPNRNTPRHTPQLQLEDVPIPSSVWATITRSTSSNIPEPHNGYSDYSHDSANRPMGRPPLPPTPHPSIWVTPTYSTRHNRPPEPHDDYSHHSPYSHARGKKRKSKRKTNKTRKHKKNKKTRKHKN